MFITTALKFLKHFYFKKSEVSIFMIITNPYTSTQMHTRHNPTALKITPAKYSHLDHGNLINRGGILGYSYMYFPETDVLYLLFL